MPTAAENLGIIPEVSILPSLSVEMAPSFRLTGDTCPPLGKLTEADPLDVHKAFASRQQALLDDMRCYYQAMADKLTQAQLQGLLEEKAALGRENEKLLQRVANLETAKTSLAARESLLSNQAQILESKVQEAEDNQRVMRNELRQARSEIAKLTKENEELSSQLQDLRSRIRNLLLEGIEEVASELQRRHLELYGSHVAKSDIIIWAQLIIIEVFQSPEMPAFMRDFIALATELGRKLGIEDVLSQLSSGKSIKEIRAAALFDPEADTKMKSGLRNLVRSLSLENLGLKFPVLNFLGSRMAQLSREDIAQVAKLHRRPPAIRASEEAAFWALKAEAPSSAPEVPPAQWNSPSLTHALNLLDEEAQVYILIKTDGSRVTEEDLARVHRLNGQGDVAGPEGYEGTREAEASPMDEDRPLPQTTEGTSTEPTSGSSVV